MTVEACITLDGLAHSSGYFLCGDEDTDMIHIFPRVTASLDRGDVKDISYCYTTHFLP